MQPAHPGELDFWRLAREAADGALSPDERARLERHLAECEGCRDVYDRFVLAARQRGGAGEGPVEFSVEELAAVAGGLGLDAPPSPRSSNRILLGGLAAALAVAAVAVVLVRTEPADDGFTERGAAVRGPLERVSFHAFCVAGDENPAVVGEILPGQARPCPTNGAVTLSARVLNARHAGEPVRLFLLDARGLPAPLPPSPEASLPEAGDERPVETALELSLVAPGRYTAVVSWGAGTAEVRSLGPLEVVSGDFEKK